MKRNFKLNLQGQSLIELIVVMGLLSIIIPAVFGFILTARESKPRENQRLQASNLIQETYEALRQVKNLNWSSVSTNGIYHPVITSNFYALASGSEEVNGFTRTITIENVLRDSSGSLVESGGTVDPSTKKFTIALSWTSPENSSVYSVGYLTRYDQNQSLTQTAEADFSAGVLTDTSVTNTSDGEIVLKRKGNGYHTQGTFESTVFDSGSNVAFNLFEFSSSTPATTTLKFQLAINTDNSTWNYFGPDQTDATYFTTTSPIPLGKVLGRYLKVKAFLEGDGETTPTIEEFTINFTP